jgi:hypothetical protein
MENETVTLTEALFVSGNSRNLKEHDTQHLANNVSCTESEISADNKEK